MLGLESSGCSDQGHWPRSLNLLLEEAVQPSRSGTFGTTISPKPLNPKPMLVHFQNRADTKPNIRIQEDLGRTLKATQPYTSNTEQP